MPSHILHEIFAFDAVTTHLPEAIATTATTRYSNALVLGAQGPDLFFHNRRRKPRGVQIGARIHKSGYGRLVGEMVRIARSDGRPSARWAYVLGFATHAVLDRHLHPFINYFSGRHQAGHPETLHLRFMHPLFERILDVLFAERTWGTHPKDIDFLARVRLPQDIERDILSLLGGSIRAAYTHDDESLDRRVENAYIDSIGYYEHSNRVRMVDLAEAARRDPERLRHWLTLVHPPVLPDGIDYANTGRRRWCLPCDSGDVRRDTVFDLYEQALGAAGPVMESISSALSRGADEAALALARIIGDSDLSSTREKRCIRRHCDPLPLHRVLDYLIEGLSDLGSS